MGVKRVFLHGMPSGVPGFVSRAPEATLESGLTGGTALAYGTAVKLDASGKFAPLSAGDTAIYGFLARPYPTGGGFGGGGNDSGDVSGGKAAPGSAQDVMRRGYMTVLCSGGTPARGGAVHVALASGQVTATAVDGETLALPAVFMASADADGNVEISYNI